MRLNFINNIIDNFKNISTASANRNIQQINYGTVLNQRDKSETVNNPIKHIMPAGCNYIMFSGKSKYVNNDEPVYAIDAYGDYVRFANIDETAKNTHTTKDRILQCANGEVECVKGIIFAFANSIEEDTRSGKQPDSMMLKLAADVIKACNRDKNELKRVYTLFESDYVFPDEQKVYTLKDIKKEDLTDKIKEKYAKSSFYVMDKTGKYKKFFRQAHVARSLDVDNRVVHKCLTGKQHMLNGLAMAYADEVEVKNEKGKIVLNLDKLRSKFKRKDGIYSVDRAGVYRKFDTPDNAVNELGVSKPSLLSCLLGKQDFTSGYAFFRASDLEIKNSDGSISVNEAKINEAKLKITSRALYVINRKGEYKRYDSQAQAAQALGVEHGSIYMCLAGQRKTVRGYIIVPANEIEMYTKDGSRIVNTKKIRQVLNNSIQETESIDVRKNGFYAINKDGECKKFYSVTSAGKELDGHLTSISNCLKGLRAYASGYVYVLAEEIEIKNENGEIELDRAKIAQKTAVLRGNPFYSIDKNGKCRLFNNQTEAAEALGMSSDYISKCLAGKQKAACDYAFMYANEIELGEQDGKMMLNWELIKEKVNYINRHALYAIDKDGNYLRFSSREEASEALGINPKSLAGCLAGNSKTASGYTFISAIEVEDRLEDGTIVVDKEKIISMTKMFKKADARRK